MSIPLPAFVAIPLVMAFLMPLIGSLLGRKANPVVTFLANAATISVLFLELN